MTRMEIQPKAARRARKLVIGDWHPLLLMLWATERWGTERRPGL